MAYCLLSVKAEQSFACLQVTAYAQQAASFLMPQVAGKVLMSCMLPWYNHSSWKFHDAQ